MSINDQTSAPQGSRTAPPNGDPAKPVGPWRIGFLAGMASFLDGGTIVGVSFVLAIWQAQFQLGPFELGLIPALMTIAVGIGGIVGGRLGDRLGRKRVYAIDLLVYAAGLLIVVVAPNAPILLVGIVVAGLAIGADIPTSLALVSESVVPEKRGRVIAFTQLMWTLGIIVASLLSATVSGAVGAFVPQALFGFFLLLAIVTWALRRGIKESRPWREAVEAKADEGVVAPRATWTPAIVRALIFTGAFYLFITLTALFAGSYGTYMLITFGGLTLSEAALWGLIGLPLAILASIAVIRLMDTRWRRPMFFVGAIVASLAWLLPVFAGGAAWSLIIATLLFGVGFTFAGEPHYKVWSQELFPTIIRGTAQGITFGVVRVLAAGWLYAIPLLLATSEYIVFWVSFGLMAVAGVIGMVFMPRRQNLSLAEIDAESVTGETFAEEAR